MASLVPIDPKGIEAHYHGLGRKLVLKAKGTIPGYFLTPFFEQDIWTGGLRFSVKAYSGGFEKVPKDKEVKFEFELPILLPIPHFNNKSVLVETAFGTSDIKIVYLEWPEDPEDNAVAVQSVEGDAGASGSETKEGKNTVILPPIPYVLTDKGLLLLSALIPKELSSGVKIDFNPEYVKLVDTKFENGFIKWDIAWNNIPTGASDPQTVHVITTINHDIKLPVIPPFPSVTIIIQPYIVSRMWMVSDKNE
ncbi:hypothetical protein IWW34DRAFT_805503 [Fusarium oxysporum f. sp. albedinis]|nr:hypothetical protein FOMA001_g14759 [Fusarium oxysporum f. sp. matthiolae]KAI3578859.1 hypothetical protein IWW34DRAFT_805503 [Fusarium oxysporum f. sp. albedinis]KAJ0153356.1 hypothetical protein HZ326_4228 [Fusarium oxysporum f. sp. albedinis]KAK2473824.1 hypothetical protein H9L39_13784 [Fusarium oxysporum f. sp. albedinis]